MQAVLAPVKFLKEYIAAFAPTLDEVSVELRISAARCLPYHRQRCSLGPGLHGGGGGGQRPDAIGRLRRGAHERRGACSLARDGASRWPAEPSPCSGAVEGRLLLVRRSLH